MIQERITVEKRRELLEKKLQGSIRLIDAVRMQIELYEGDMVKLRNERYEIEHELSMLEVEYRGVKKNDSKGKNGICPFGGR